MNNRMKWLGAAAGVGLVGALGLMTALVSAPPSAISQCGMMGAGGHDQHASAHDRGKVEERFRTDIDDLMSDDRGRGMLMIAVLSDREFASELIPRLLADEEWSALAAQELGRTTPEDRRPAPDAGDRAAALYVCPMHPDVTASSPGRCPACGMKLVRKTAASPD